jgi:hypothetical protein
MENKIPNNISDIIKLSIDNQKNKLNNPYVNDKTDFSKKKSFKTTVKEFINKTIKNIKNNKLFIYLKNWFWFKFGKPYKDWKLKKENEKHIKTLKYNFSKTFNVDVDKLTTLMNHSGFTQRDINSDNELLIKNRLYINKRKSLYKFAPIMFDPHITEIHNDNLDKNNPTIHQIVSDDSNQTSNQLDRQLEFFRKRPNLTVGNRS